MDTNIISGTIAFVGVLISILVTLYINSNRAKVEDKRFYQNIEQNYLNVLLKKRIDEYWKLYEILSDFIKTIQTNKKVKQSELNEFFQKTNKENSKIALFFSVETSDAYYHFWKYILDLVNQSHDIDDPKEIEELRQEIQRIEIQLKKDIGIYLIDFEDGKKQKQLPSSYGEIIKKYNSKTKN